MATWDDVRRDARRLPETDERMRSDETLQWRVAGKLFVWERPLRRADLAWLGDAAPAGPVLGARVVDEGVKAALLAEQPGVFFTTPHFDGHASILVRLDRIAAGDLSELVLEAWYCRAPKRLHGKVAGHRR